MSKRLKKRRGVCPPGLRQNTYRLFFCFSRKPFQALAGLRGFEQYSCIIKKASATKVADAFLVEARGVEPLSENLLIWLSPGAGGYLDFPMAVGNRHPAVTGSFFLHDCLKSKRAMHVHRSMTPHPKPRYSWVERAVPQDCVTALGCVS